MPVARFSTSPKFVSSPAEKTLGWLDKMRSTSVVPVRGMPTMKIGSREAQPSPSRPASAGRQPFRSREQRLVGAEIVAQRGGFAALAAREQAKRGFVSSLVLVLLRERVAEMQLGVRVDRRLLERALERCDLDRRQRRARDLARARPGAMEARLETQRLAVLELGCLAARRRIATTRRGCSDRRACGYRARLRGGTARAPRHARRRAS